MIALLRPRRAMTAALTLDVDRRRMLRQVGRLFSRPSDAMGEVVQNAYRAGADTLRVTREGRILTFADDGPGVSDPRSLFTVAASGWEDGEVVEPAGMGAFALFSLADRVVVTSVPAGDDEGWRATFGPDAFEGAPIEVEPVAAGEREPGLTLRVALREDVDLPDLTDPSWRHCFPLTVEVRDGADETFETLEPVEVAGERISTPVGTLVYQPPGRQRPPGRAEAVWEHRLVGEAVDGGLAASICGGLADDDPADRVLAACLDAGHLVWEVDPDTGVRPQLPDRNRLVQNGALADALVSLRDALRSIIDRGVLEEVVAEHTRGAAVCSLGHHRRSLDRADALCGPLLPGRHQGPGLIDVLPALGYERGWAARPPEEILVYALDTTGALEVELQDECSPAWARPAYRAASDVVEHAALAADVPAVTDPAASDLPELSLGADEVFVSTETGHVFCRGLRLVAGGEAVAPVDHSLPAGAADLARGASGVLGEALQEARRTCERDGGLTARGLHPVAPEDAYDFIRDDPAFVRVAGAAAVLNNDYELLSAYIDSTSGDVQEVALSRDLAQSVAREQGGDLARRADRRAAAERLVAALGDLHVPHADALRKHLDEAADLDLDARSLEELRWVVSMLDHLYDELTVDQLLADPSPEPDPVRAGRSL